METESRNKLPGVEVLGQRQPARRCWEAWCRETKGSSLVWRRRVWRGMAKVVNRPVREGGDSDERFQSSLQKDK